MVRLLLLVLIDEQTGSGDDSGVVYVYDRVGVGNSFNQVGILTGSLAVDVKMISLEIQ
jgi:hypothetical protein